MTPSPIPDPSESLAADLTRMQLTASVLLEALKETVEHLVDYQELCRVGGWPAVGSSVRQTLKRVRGAIKTAAEATDSIGKAR